MKQSTLNNLAAIISALLLSILLISRGAPFITILLADLVIAALAWFANMTGNLGIDK